MKPAGKTYRVGRCASAASWRSTSSTDSRAPASPCSGGGRPAFASHPRVRQDGVGRAQEPVHPERRRHPADLLIVLNWAGDGPRTTSRAEERLPLPPRPARARRTRRAPSLGRRTGAEDARCRCASGSARSSAARWTILRCSSDSSAIHPRLRGRGQQVTRLPTMRKGPTAFCGKAEGTSAHRAAASMLPSGPTKRRARCEAERDGD